jgi:ADP-ribose pyrophosphatase YjhB (NUDIX family)
MDEMTWQRSLPRKWMAAGVVIRDVEGRVLMVEPTYKEAWEIPGGVVEADESPRAACRRELREELGLAIEPGRLLCWEWQHAEADRTESMMFVYDGGLLPHDAVLRLPADELASYRFVAVEQLGEVTVERLARRIRAALHGLELGTVIELESGHEAVPGVR